MDNSGFQSWAEKVPRNPGATFCAGKSGSIQRIIRTFQKYPDMIQKGLPLAKSETEHHNK